MQPEVPLGMPAVSYTHKLDLTKVQYELLTWLVGKGFDLIDEDDIDDLEHIADQLGMRDGEKP